MSVSSIANHHSYMDGFGRYVSEKNIVFFLITGLPRSRTAWIAQYFQGLEGVSCFHEPESKENDIASVLDRLSDVYGLYSGISSSAISFWTDNELKSFNGCKSLIIERNIDDVIESLNKAEMGLSEDTNIKICDYIIKSYERIEKSTDCMKIKYGNLDDPYYMKSIQNHLTPQTMFDYKYWEYMMEANIQIDMNKWKRNNMLTGSNNSFVKELERRINFLIKW